MEEHFSSDNKELCDEDYEGELTGKDISAIYNDRISAMKRIDEQKMAMMLYDNYVERMGFQKTEAVKEVGLFLGVNDQTFRSWRREFLCSGEFSEDNRGKHARHQGLIDEDYRDIALDWVRNHSSVKGKPNMTASDFCEWINKELLPIMREHQPNTPHSISVRTAPCWLHKLGLIHVVQGKVYILMVMSGVTQLNIENYTLSDFINACTPTIL